VPGFQKVRNVERDPRVAVCVADPADPGRYVAIRGRVVKVTTLISPSRWRAKCFRHCEVNAIDDVTHPVHIIRVTAGG
jgi:Pyridoxamine 5'-phosphate oxidase